MRDTERAPDWQSNRADPMPGAPESSRPVRDGPGGPERSSSRSWFERQVMELLPVLLDGARSMTGHSDEAEDLVARTIARGWERRRDLRDRDRLRGWLFRIMRNSFLERERRRARRPERLSLPCEGDEEASFSLFEHLHQPFLLWAGNPEERFLDALLERDLRSAVDALPECFRTVVTLVDVRGFTYAEVAEILDLPIGTVRSRLARGRARLQRHLWDHAVDRGIRDHDLPPGSKNA